MGMTLHEIGKLVDGKIVGDPRVEITGINSLEYAESSDISFFFSPKYRELLKTTKARAILVKEQTSEFPGPQVIVANPEVAYAKLASIFAPPSSRFDGVSTGAYIHRGARVGEGASIYPFVYVGEGSRIGENTILFPGVYVGNNVRIGTETIIYPNVTILDGTIIGSRVVIHSGTVIGSDGFGFVQQEGISIKLPQMGYVQIEDNVEIGANCSIDRATFGRTWIKEGVKMDNLVQIAHNVVVGEHSIIVAQAGVSGSVTLGKQVVIGGQVGISDHLSIGDKVMIGSQSGVAKSIPSGEIVSGTPTLPHRRWLRCMGLVGKLPEINDRIRELERKVADLEKHRHKGE